MNNMKVTDLDYVVVEDFNVNIRVSKDKILTDESGNELTKIPIIDYAQAKLTHSDMEDLMESANAMANSVALYYKTNSLTPDLTVEELNEVRPIIGKAIETLLNNFTNKEFVEQYVRTLHPKGEGTHQVNRFVYSETIGNDKTFVYLTYIPQNVLSKELVYPVRPGAVVNTFNTVEFTTK